MTEGSTWDKHLEKSKKFRIQLPLIGAVLALPYILALALQMLVVDAAARTVRGLILHLGL